MAANFWASSHSNSWIIKKEDYLKDRFHARDLKHFTQDEIRKLKLYFSQYLHSVGTKMKIRQRAIATALIYLHRFYFKNPLLNCDPHLLIPTALLLACKAEEYFQNVTGILSAMGSRFPYKDKDVMECEYFLLEELNFHLLVFHLYRPLTMFIADAGLQDCAQTAWNLANDSLLTDLCLLYPPHMVALGCIYMASIMTDKDIRPWLRDMNVDMHEIGDIAAEMLEMYELSQDVKTDEKETAGLVSKLNSIIAENRSRS